MQEVASSDGGLDFIVDCAADNLTELLGELAKADIAIMSVDVDEPNLEAVFLHLTGRALRD